MSQATPMKPMDVFGEKVFVANVHGMLFVPMKTLTVSTLGMHWPPQAKKLARYEDRWQVQSLAVSDASGRRTTQPCLQAWRLTAFLWLLRPTKPEIQEKVARLQDAFGSALLRHLKIDLSEIGEAGEHLIPAFERTVAPLIEQIASLKAKVTELEKQVAAAPQHPIEARWGKKVTTRETFIEIAKLADAEMDFADIANKLGCSRTMVSEFLRGMYWSRGSHDALDHLKKSDWKPKTEKIQQLIARKIPGRG